ncbi:MAG: tetratricopeptide repeat protein [Thermoflexales bacterium]|nr:tetratricopeptide repeat protein [Thermoflexales bacterium]
MIDTVQLREQGLALFRQGRFEEAATHLAEACQAYTAQGDWAAAAEALNDQGVCLRQAGRLEEAEKALLEARGLFQKTANARGEAGALGNLGAVYESLGQEAKAIGLYRESIGLLEECGEQAMARDTWLALGRLRLRKHQWLPALAAYDMGLEDAKDLSASQRTLRTLLRFTRRIILR